jgi:flavodoxin
VNPLSKAEVKMTNKVINRRDALASGMLALIASQAANSRSHAQGTNGKRLVAFLSRSGNTRVLADALAREFEADLFEIRPRDPWPEDYEEMVDWATRIRESDMNLPLAESLASLSNYQTVFLGFPIWGMAMPSVMTSFLKQHDFSGKTIAPFITHGGYGVGSAIKTIRALLPQSGIRAPFILECDQERATLNQLRSWLAGLDKPL